MKNKTQPQKHAKSLLIACPCGATADLKDNPHAWDGWQVIPGFKCPTCIDNDMAKSARRKTMRDKTGFSRGISLTA